jgi:hypothetical protein
MRLRLKFTVGTLLGSAVLGVCELSPSAAAEGKVPTPRVSLCDIGRAGAHWNGKIVHVQAVLVTDSLGGELRDDRCSNVILGFADDLDAEPNTTYQRFSSSADRDLLARGKSRQRIELVGLVESPGSAGAGRAYGSVIKLTKILKFSRLP